MAFSPITTTLRYATAAIQFAFCPGDRLECMAKCSHRAFMQFVCPPFARRSQRVVHESICPVFQASAARRRRRRRPRRSLSG